ncbi:MAG: B12-binding domain-containing radical SAM protein [Thermodesulfobacteriota bacterium]
MKAVVLIPPVYDFYFTPHRSAGLGAEILCKLLQAKGWQTRLLNFPLESKKGVNQDLPSALGYLKPYLMEGETGQLSFFTRYQRFGPAPEDCVRQVLADAPDLILISCFAFCYASAAVDLAAKLRKADPRPVIACGGAGVSAHPEYFIRHPAVDYAFTGEAEVFLPDFLETIASGSRDFSRIANLFWKNSDGLITAPSGTRQTLPGEIAFTLKKTMETTAAVYFSTTLSRGCPKKCRFCSNFISHGRQFRTIPPATIEATLAGMKIARETRGKPVYINFEDDNFLCDPAYFFSVLDRFRAVFPEAGFLAENGIDYTLITPDLLDRLIRSGFRQFNLSMVSTDEKLLDRENRSASRQLYETITATLKRNNLPCITYFICGLKNDTREKVAATLAYLAGQETRVGISLFYPVPGIPDYQDKSFFDGIDPCRCAGSSAYPWNGSLTTRELVTAFRLSRLVNLMKSERRTDADRTLIAKSIRERRLYTESRNRGGREIVPVPDMDEELLDLFFGKLQSGAV